MPPPLPRPDHLKSHRKSFKFCFYSPRFLVLSVCLNFFCLSFFSYIFLPFPSLFFILLSLSLPFPRLPSPFLALAARANHLIRRLPSAASASRCYPRLPVTIAYFRPSRAYSLRPLSGAPVASLCLGLPRLPRMARRPFLFSLRLPSRALCYFFFFSRSFFFFFFFLALIMPCTRPPPSTVFSFSPSSSYRHIPSLPPHHFPAPSSFFISTSIHSICIGPIICNCPLIISHPFFVLLRPWPPT